MNIYELDKIQQITDRDMRKGNNINRLVQKQRNVFNFRNSNVMGVMHFRAQTHAIMRRIALYLNVSKCQLLLHNKQVKQYLRHTHGRRQSVCEGSSASKSSIPRFVITEKAPTRAFSWLKVAFTFKNLLQPLRHYANQPACPS